MEIMVKLEKFLFSLMVILWGLISLSLLNSTCTFDPFLPYFLEIVITIIAIGFPLIGVVSFNE